MNPSEIAERVEKSEEIKCLFQMAEESFGRPLNHTEPVSYTHLKICGKICRMSWNGISDN